VDAIVTVFFVVVLLSIIGMIILLVRDLRSGITSWRDVASQIALGSTLVSAAVFVRYLVGPVVWGDCSATAGSVVALKWILQWGHLGMCFACIGAASSLFSRGWTRIVALLCSILFVSFWLYVCRIVEAL
jgi:hypothetical protein